MTCVIPSQSHDISSFLMPVIQCILAQWRHISSESAVALLFHLCSHILIFVAKCDAQSKAWDILLVLTSVAGNLCNKCPSSYSNKTAVKVILWMLSLVSIEQQSLRRPCDKNGGLLFFCIHASKGPVIIMKQLKSIYNSPLKDPHSYPIHTCFPMIAINVKGKWWGSFFPTPC